LKTRSEVKPDKLRGGFYTPAPLVRHALQRLQQLLPSRQGLRMLEPGAGDGAFLRGLGPTGIDPGEVVAVEIDPEAVEASRVALRTCGVPGQVIQASTLAWSLRNDRDFDAVIGNLPFVRFQFVDQKDRSDALRHGEDLGVSVAGVANLWLPMLLASLRHLRRGGAFVLVLPAECFTGISAGTARRWLLANMDDLRCDLYPAGSFPGVLQEIVLLSGRRIQESAGMRTLRVVQHRDHCSSADFDESVAETQDHLIRVGNDSWTHLLLTRTHLAALEEARSLDCVRQLGLVARFEVAAVTGANSFFSLSLQDVCGRDLHRWSRPLLARLRHAPGLRFTKLDHQNAANAGVPAFMFDASLSPIDPAKHTGVHDYIAEGERRGLHERYKCRIRDPWYAIPYIKRGALLLSKRCHRYPRMILNETDAVTTDTIYRGRMMDPSARPVDVVAGFHNSLTLLSAELAGRNFGGGVLELVPSEVARLEVPIVQGIGDDLAYLDALCREANDNPDPEAPSEALVYESDLLLAKADVGLTLDLLATLSDARAVLLRRRMERGARPRF
jgi:adenine-specific DNA-methyltransferase